MSLRVSYDDIFAPVSAGLLAVESRLREWFDEEPLLAELAGGFVCAGGKRLRPACLLLAAGLRRGVHAEERDGLTELASAVEMVHAASLIHDDIVDSGTLRRGAPSVPARFGDGVAVLAGDLLYSRLFRRLTAEEGTRHDLPVERGKALRVVAAAVHRMVLGELEETTRRHDLSLSEADYFRIVADKTGSLFSCATRLGALAAGLGEEEASRLSRYGELLGVAYQIVDDVMDFCAGEDETGKSPGGDVREGKLTLPSIRALARDGADGDRAGRAFASRDAHGVAEIARECGAFAYSLSKAEGAAREAESCLAGLPEGPCLAALRALPGRMTYSGTCGLPRPREGERAGLRGAAQPPLTLTLSP